MPIPHWPLYDCRLQNERMGISLSFRGAVDNIMRIRGHWTLLGPAPRCHITSWSTEVSHSSYYYGNRYFYQIIDIPQTEARARPLLRSGQSVIVDGS